MRLHCPDCQSEILADNINLTTLTAKCTQCNAVFSFADKLPTRPPAAQTSAAPQSNAILPKPPQMVIEEAGGDWRISWKWFNWSYVPLAGFCVFWDGFLVFWYTIAFAKHGPLVMKLFPLLHVTVGFAITYAVLSGFLNRTVVRISANELIIRHFPLPWWGNRRFAAGTIQQLYCERSFGNSKGSVTFQLSAVIGEGKPLRILGGFRYLAEPKFLEQQLEKRLRITPKAVVGECNS